MRFSTLALLIALPATAYAAAVCPQQLSARYSVCIALGLELNRDYGRYAPRRPRALPWRCQCFWSERGVMRVRRWGNGHHVGGLFLERVTCATWRPDESAYSRRFWVTTVVTLKVPHTQRIPRTSPGKIGRLRETGVIYIQHCYHGM
ncbi:hypothetical protein V8E53_010612 [Lactarius tabidus]